jgi:hypothetical protein
VGTPTPLLSAFWRILMPNGNSTRFGPRAEKILPGQFRITKSIKPAPRKISHSTIKSNELWSVLPATYPPFLRLPASPKIKHCVKRAERSHFKSQAPVRAGLSGPHVFTFRCRYSAPLSRSSAKPGSDSSFSAPFYLKTALSRGAGRRPAHPGGRSPQRRISLIGYWGQWQLREDSRGPLFVLLRTGRAREACGLWETVHF